jgi:hypothetical protein
MSHGSHCISYNNKKGFMQASYGNLRGWAKATGTEEDVYLITTGRVFKELRRVAKLLGEPMRRATRVGVTLENRPRLAKYPESEPLAVIMSVPEDFEKKAKYGPIWVISFELFRQFRIQLGLDGIIGLKILGKMAHGELKFKLPNSEEVKTVTFKNWRIFYIVDRGK